jgi:hypothetical protein
MGSSKGGGECELGLPQLDGDDLVGHGDVVPCQLDDMLDVLAEDDDQDGGCPVSHSELWDCQILEEGRDVALSDPGHSAVGSLHRLQCRGYRDQIARSTETFRRTPWKRRRTRQRPSIV